MLLFLVHRKYFDTLKFLSLVLFFASLSFFPAVNDSAFGSAVVEDLNSLLQAGKIQIRDGYFEEAMTSLEQCLVLAIRSENKKFQTECFMNLGLVSWNLSEIEKSSEYYAQASLAADELDLPLIKENAETFLEIIDLYSEGIKYQLERLLEESIGSFQKAIILAQDIKSLPHELKCLRVQSMNYMGNLDNDKFLEMNKRALEIAQTLNHRTEIVKALNSIGGYCFIQNDLSCALIHCFEAVKLAREIDDKASIPRSLINLANVYLLFGDFQKSYEYLSEALSINREKKNSVQIPSILNSLGLLFENKALETQNEEDFYKALEYFEDSLEAFRAEQQESHELMVLNNMGDVYSGLKKYDQALEYFSICLEKLKNGRDDQFLGVLSANIGDLQLELQNLGEAERFYLQALKLGEETGATDILRRAHFGLARIDGAQKKYDSSIFHYKEAIKNVEKVRSGITLDVNKAGYVHSKLNIYEHLLELYYLLNSENEDNNYTPEMFLTAEQGKARSFLENLMESKVNVDKEISDEYGKKENELTNRIASYLQELSRGKDSPKIKTEPIEKELLRADEEYALLLQQMLQERAGISEVISPKPFNLEYIQERYLGENTVLIEFYLGEKKSFLFFISKNILKVFELPPHPEIRDSVKGYLKILTEPSEEEDILKKAGRRLYTELLSPLENVIPEGITNLIIIPDGILYYLPFETLITASLNTSNRDEYLISKYTVSYMPSASSLLFLNDKRTNMLYPKDILLFGEPDYSRQPPSKSSGKNNPMEVIYNLYENQGYEFLPLPYSRKEVKGISKYFSSPKADIFLGEKASEKTVKNLPLADYRVIHIACHSFLDETYPLRSSLVLSFNDSTDEDGFLNVREIYGLNLRPELIVLSACRTGKGKLEGSDGVLGLPRIFFYAGAMSVVSTLWGVNDRSSVSFMNFFYRSLSEGQSKAQALRSAKMEMIGSKYSHPYHWGAFILNGDYRTSIFSK